MNEPARRHRLKQLSLAVPAILINSNMHAGEPQKQKPLIKQRKIPLSVSTYSYWHFKPEKYPIEKVIEHAAETGFDGVEILHRQMTDESPAYLNKTTCLHTWIKPSNVIHTSGLCNTGCK